jgi:DNA-binding NtrC family response regulator
MSGSAWIRNARKTNPNVRVIVISRKDSAAVTQQIVRMRVDDYFILPSQGDAFSAAVAACADCGKTAGYDGHEQPGLIGQSANIVALRKYVSRVALSDSNVLILGETGAGKELVAELIHKSGPRRNKPCVAVNAAAVPEPLFESELFGYEKGAFTGAYTRSLGKLRQAHGGTIFFDEIGDIGPGAQAKLLRAIETREVYPLGTTRGTNIDVRLLAATNRDIDSIVKSGEFRQDLFYRLDVVRIDIPPLRNNREDIPLLLTHFVSSFNRRFGRKILGFEQNAADLLAAYDWPGNIRQLRNVVEGCFVKPATRTIFLVRRVR